jgi:hypothetical protein
MQQWQGLATCGSEMVGFVKVEEFLEYLASS